MPFELNQLGSCHMVGSETSERKNKEAQSSRENTARLWPYQKEGDRKEKKREVYLSRDEKRQTHWVVVAC